jgi:hypothetical protein
MVSVLLSLVLLLLVLMCFGCCISLSSFSFRLFVRLLSCSFPLSFLLFFVVVCCRLLLFVVVGCVVVVVVVVLLSSPVQRSLQFSSLECSCILV